jgi:citronellol/citronellal dehydrogenase
MEVGTLKDAVAVVTGASRGLGEAISLELASAGAAVVVVARTEVEKDPRLPGTIYHTVDKIKEMGGKALAVRADISNEQDVDNLQEAALAAFGHVDVLVNNAGISIPGPLLEIPIKRWDLVWRVNVRAAIDCAQAFLPSMIERRQGTVIFMSSAMAEMTGDGNLPYVMTKMALRKLASGLAEEVRSSNIKVFSLSPTGLVATPGVLHTGGMRLVEESGFVVEPAEAIGQAVVHLASRVPIQESGRHFYCADLLSR